MIFKRLGAICFAAAFIFGIGVFTNTFNAFLSRNMATIGVIISGGLAFLMNLLALRYDEKNENANPIFWIGSIIVFVGLILKMKRMQYDQWVIILGILITGISFFFNPFQKEDQNKDDILDA